MITVGLDEVGRGCWAGPLVAAAVALPDDVSISGLNDSKKLSKLQREKLVVVIEEKATAIGVGWVWPDAIDNGGITQAVKSAMEQAFSQIHCKYDELIVDGHINYLVAVPGSQAIIKADGSVPAVSAASIIAKVARDRYMTGIAAQYRGYGFERHVGYGTKAHIEALATYGVTDMHRRSYKPIKALLH
jgi:ribonuclease HII